MLFRRLLVTLVLGLLLGFATWLTRLAIYEDFFLCFDPVPPVGERWRDPGKIQRITGEHLVSSMETRFIGLAGKDATFKGKFELNLNRWRCSPFLLQDQEIRAQDVVRFLKYDKSVSDGNPLGKLRVDVLRRSRFAPGFDSVARWTSSIYRFEESNGFTCYARLPIKPGDYLLVGHVVPHDSLGLRTLSKKTEMTQQSILLGGAERFRMARTIPEDAELIFTRELKIISDEHPGTDEPIRINF